jgi:hypothetical protein
MILGVHSRNTKQDVRSQCGNVYINSIATDLVRSRAASPARIWIRGRHGTGPSARRIVARDGTRATTCDRGVEPTRHGASATSNTAWAIIGAIASWQRTCSPGHRANPSTHSRSDRNGTRWPISRAITGSTRGYRKDVEGIRLFSLLSLLSEFLLLGTPFLFRLSLLSLLADSREPLATVIAITALTVFIAVRVRDV